MYPLCIRNQIEQLLNFATILKESWILVITIMSTTMFLLIGNHFVHFYFPMHWTHSLPLLGTNPVQSQFKSPGLWKSCIVSPSGTFFFRSIYALNKQAIWPSHTQYAIVKYGYTNCKKSSGRKEEQVTQ